MSRFSRRGFLSVAAPLAAGAVGLAPRLLVDPARAMAPAPARRAAGRAASSSGLFITHGVASGDVTANSAVPRARAPRRTRTSPPSSS